MSSIGQPTVNRIILGDNLEILRGMPDESVDLIYLDPPFFSNRDYEVIWGDEGEIRSFQDRWAGGIENYIAWLKERVVEMHRVLKKTGSFFLHCDWHANAYIRVDILDKVFDKKRFLNEFVWKRSTTRSSISKAARKNYDTIFLYTKSANYTFDQLFMELSEASKELYKHKDERGQYQLVPLLVSGKRRGETGKIWKGLDPNKQGQEGMHWVTTPDKLDEYDEQGLVYYPPSGKTPRLKYYIDQTPGVPMNELWDDIPLVQGNERIGYPTQKPEALLERIIRMSSQPGDIVLDPFCGGGTTLAVADKLGRQWIGIDQSVAAVKVSELRLNKQQDLLSVPFSVHLHKYDYDMLRSMNEITFQDWIISQYGGHSNPKKGNEKGIDGWMPDGTPIQVKRTDRVGRVLIDEFVAAIPRKDKNLFKKNKADKKPVGYFIAFSYGKGAIEEVARLKNSEGIIIKLLKVEDIVPLAKKPKIKVDFTLLSTNAFGQREIELTATGESDAGIEFYSWDFAYDEKEGFKPVVIRDTDGLQTYKFNVGVHHIAVKVVDNEGLESIEVVPLHINGGVKRKG